ncbi:16368_t:CDS:2, partial [Dentiscutata heterogama]
MKEKKEKNKSLCTTSNNDLKLSYPIDKQYNTVDRIPGRKTSQNGSYESVNDRQQKQQRDLVAQYLVKETNLPLCTNKFLTADSSKLLDQQSEDYC